MFSFKSFLPASAVLFFFSAVNAGVIVQRNQEPAQPSCTSYTNFTYSGCFQDLSVIRALLYSGPSTNNMTIDTCIAFCKGNDYRYAGLEYYQECFCGASVNGPAATDPAEQCDLPCTGNANEVCGGNDYISIYQDPTFPVVNDSVITDYQYLGCYSEGTNGRALAWQQNQISSTDMTVESCLFACKDGGYDFAGVEYASQCFCGVVLGNGTLPVASTDCDMPCTGNPSEICGGSSVLNLYVATDLESTDPCGLSSSSSSSAVSSTTTTSSTSTSPTTATTTTTSTPSFTVSSSSTTSSPSSSTASSTTTTSSTSTFSTSTRTTATSTSSSTLSSTSSISSSSSSSTASSTTSSSSTSSHTASTSCTTTPRPTSSPASTSTSTRITASLCTSTTVISPTPTCEYQCGNWCSNPLAPFSDAGSCSTAAANCAVQVSSCFLNAGFPSSMNCFQYSNWCSSVSNYCNNYCPGGSCSVQNCKSKYPPSGPPAPPPTTSTIVYTCSVPTTTLTTTISSTSSSVPVPTSTNICTQPSNRQYGYSPSSPVGGISLPCLTCNNLLSDYNAGNIFKLYTSSQSSSCNSYKALGCSQGCKDACDAQYSACTRTYAASCSSNSPFSIWGQGADSVNSATTKCINQWNDCYSVNSGVTGSGKCSSFNSGW